MSEVQYQIGRMVKEPKKMSLEECIAWQKQCAENAKEYLFSIGQPLVYKRQDGHTVAEYKNGNILVIR
jgi:DNA modification methylase